MNNQWRFKGNEMQYLEEVVLSGEGSGTSGGMNNKFEMLFAEKVGAKHAVTFNSGTGTLHAALTALGVSYGDEVIIPPLTVISNIDVIIAQNAIPVFADIDIETFNIDPNDVRKKITPKTKAIMPVSLYGLSCDLDSLTSISKEYNIGLINDAAQAHGATYKNKLLGNIADITSYSTENSKHISTGDGGIVVTDDEYLAVKMRKFGSLGYAAMKASDGRVRLNKSFFQDPNYKRHDAFGYNYRMPEVAAAMGLAQTERYEYFIGLREDIGKMYLEVVNDCDFLIPQKEVEGSRNTYWSFACRMIHADISWYEFRDKFVEFGGESIFACWALTYEEPVIADGAYKSHAPEIYNKLKYTKGICPNAEEIQPQLMQFITNYKSIDEAKLQINALRKTVNYFK